MAAVLASRSTGSTAATHVQPASDENVAVETTYNPDGQVLTLTAKNPTTGDQVTRYVYGTTLTDSEIARADLLRAEIYPDSDDTTDPLGDGADGVYDRVEYKYNRQGERITKKDQNETVHTYEYDGLGRQVHDRVTAVGSGVDGAVRRISTVYEVRGRAEKLTSYDNATVGSGSVVSEVLFEYDETGRLAKEYQEHDGPKDANTPYVGHHHDTTASGGRYTKALRPTALRYPNGRLVHYTYGDLGSTADCLNRIDSICDDDSGSPGDVLSQYSYLGLGTIVVEDYAEPDVKLDYVGDGSYSGFDRFGRVVDQRWYDYGASEDRDRYTYGYDRASNRLYRENTTTTGKDEVYTYDGMNRLVTFDRGDLNAEKTAISGTPVREEDWTLDPIGNWTDYQQRTSGSTDLDQDRTHNAVNEITAITATTGTDWADPVHDACGNMTTLPKPSSPADSLTCQYDAWNRLVAVQDGQTVVGKYEYDGLNRRIKKHYDSAAPDNPTGIDQYTHYFYNAAWQALETRDTDSETAEAQTLQPKYQYVWSLRYIDVAILRDENTDQNALCNDQRLYSLGDANFNVTTLVDTAGDPLEHYVYDAYGNVTFYDTAWASTRTTSSYGYSALYTGRECDGESLLYHYRNRHYSAMLGSFISRDPMRLRTDPNEYAYCVNNPLNRTDPSGMASESPDGKPCPIEGTVVSSRVFGAVPLWVGMRNPGGLQRAIGLVNSLAEALNLFDEIPDPLKPPVGVAPGTGDAADALKEQILALFPRLAKREGVRIWVKIACKICECQMETVWWGPFPIGARTVLRWRELPPVWYLCSATGKFQADTAFDPVHEFDIMMNAIPGCVREAWRSRDCYESSHPAREPDAPPRTPPTPVKPT